MVYLLCLLLAACSFTHSEDKWEELGKDQIPVEKVLKHKGVIWGFDFLNDQELLITKRDGEFYHYNLTTKEMTKLAAPKVWAKGQGGLLDVLVLAGKVPTVFLTYSKPTKETAVTALAKGQWVDGQLQKLQDILITNSYSDKSIHFGSRLAVRGDELFMTVGERGEREKAQSLQSHQGKILRLTLDGKPYPGNPFGKSGLPEIYSYGHRNPQGIAIDLDGKQIFNCEFGPRGGDEINLVQAGKNYGWPVITYGFEYYGPKIGTEKKEGMEQPLVHYTPSISPSGMTIYSGKVNSKFRGNFFLAALGNRYVHRVVFDQELKVKKQQKWLADVGERVRQIKEGPDGKIYFSTDSGNIYKINMDKIKVE